MGNASRALMHQWARRFRVVRTCVGRLDSVRCRSSPLAGSVVDAFAVVVALERRLDVGRDLVDDVDECGGELVAAAGVGADFEADFEHAILIGHKVFRALRDNNGGYVDFDATHARTLSYRSRDETTAADG